MKSERVAGVKCFTKLSEMEHHLEEPTGSSTIDISDIEIHEVEAWAQPYKRHMNLVCGMDVATQLVRPWYVIMNQSTQPEHV